jgi:hypothetical protein
MRIRHFQKNWTGQAATWIPVMEAKCRETWSKEFLPPAPPQPEKKREDSFLNDLMGLLSKDVEKDEFESYTHSDPTSILDPKTFNPISWWDNAKSTFP